MSLYLTVVNLIAGVGAAVALIRYRRSRTDHSDVGCALMVALTAILFLALAGLARRAKVAGMELAITLDVELLIAAAWTAAAVAAWWTATHPSLRRHAPHQDAPSPKDRE